MEDEIPENTLDLELACANHGAIESHIRDLLTDGKSVGLYAPLRALPYLSGIDSQMVTEQVRFIDDTVHWWGKKFDGCDVPIENSDDISRVHPDEIIIFSLTFEKLMRKKLLEKQIYVKTYSLRQLLQG